MTNLLSENQFPKKVQEQKNTKIKKTDKRDKMSCLSVLNSKTKKRNIKIFL